MTTLDHFFSDSAIDAYPQLKRILSAGGAAVEFERKRDGLAFQPVSLVVRGQPRAQRIRWMPEVNRALIGRGVRAIDEKNEAERFGYMLNELFAGLEVRYGDGFFNAALIRFLGSDAFSSLKSVQERIKEIRRPHLVEGRRIYGECEKDMTAILTTVGGWLKQSLRYDQTTSERILDGAIAYYLDNRFHLSNRRLLGIR